MKIPWNDHAVASIDGQEGRDIVVQGPLHVVISFLATKCLNEQRRMLIALPDRNVSPRRYDGNQIGALAASLHRERRVAATNSEAGKPESFAPQA